MLKKILTHYFCRKIYPTNSSDWYKRKGYKGKNDSELFADFLAKQQQKSAIFYDCFKGLKLKRFKVQSNQEMLDCVSLEPEKIEDDIKLLTSSARKYENIRYGQGKIFLLFQGKGEYYESRYRDMAMLSHATGAKVIGFNPKGFHSSTGKTTILADIVDDGENIIHYLFAQKYKPQDIIMLGNSLGGGIQEMVCARLQTIGIKGFRQINSNSFNSISAVLARKYRMSFLQSFLSKLLKYAGWEIEVDELFYEVGLNRIHLRRYKDRTILPGAEFHDAIDIEQSITKLPKKFKEEMEWIIRHNQLILDQKSDKDPHDLGLHKFIVRKISEDNSDFHSKIGVFDLINKYLCIIFSNDYETKTIVPDSDESKFQLAG